MQMQVQLRTLTCALAMMLGLAGCADDDGPGSLSEGSTGTTEVASTTGDVATTGEPPVGECGDGVVDEGEGCDEGEVNGEGASCTPLCQPARCGDGFVGPGEGCDDGNEDDDDACTNACKGPTCGDGVVQSGAEECDDGNGDNSDNCLDTCVLWKCGDGFVRAETESCDDANQDNSDSCLNSCKLAACGDGFVWEGEEDCDDSNADNSDSCLTCEIARCGDGFVNEGIEACDDGNEVDDDNCNNLCAKPATCDDGVKNGTETHVDCGGPLCAGCEEGEGCVSGDDCASTFCGDKVCVTPRHCRDIKEQGLAKADGMYLVDPDGPGQGEPALFNYCEMTFNGGGWTAVFNMREKPVGEASAAAMLATISKNGPIDVVLPSSNSPAILTQGLDLSLFTEALFGWAPAIAGDVTRYGTLTRPEGLAGVCYLDGFCGAGKEVGEFDLTPNGSKRVLFTGKATDAPHVGLGFDDQIILWGYDRNQQNGSNWGNWEDDGPCCKAGNTPAITTIGWRYVIYLR
jgi:cysteine-rich repeat protein